MKVVIVGAGNVGMTLARTLSEDAHDVVVVDRNEDLATRIAEELDVSVVRGNGSRPD
ncbi:MAG: NAD-binding protein, partial [Pyramidobacter sp.]|nr:NAD-binding protein [Pyramidobacter sp.]